MCIRDRVARTVRLRTVRGKRHAHAQRPRTSPCVVSRKQAILLVSLSCRLAMQPPIVSGPVHVLPGNIHALPRCLNSKWPRWLHCS
eukprot:1187859-Alexandrium_andersonii.AAC.1